MDGSGLGSLLQPPRRGEPCPVCGGHDCAPAPDIPIHHRYPFIPPEGRMPAPDAEHEECEEQDEPRGRRKGKRARKGPDEDRAHHGPEEDR